MLTMLTMLTMPITTRCRRSKNVVVATSDIAPQTLLAEIPVTFYMGNPHGCNYPPIARFSYNSTTQHVSDYRDDHENTPFHYTLYVCPSDRPGAVLAGLTGGKYIRDAACYDIPTVAFTAHGCSSADDILQAARGAEAAVVADLQIHFETPGYSAQVADAAGRIRSKPLRLNENQTQFSHFNRARVYVRALQCIPAETPIHIRYPSVFWSHPHVRFRYRILKPALCRLQQYAGPQQLEHQFPEIQSQLQNQGVAHVRNIFGEDACVAMDRVLHHIVTEANMACEPMDIFCEEKEQTYRELTYRQNRIDLTHPELLHFAEFAPWAGLMPRLMGSSTTTVMQGGLFRLFSTSSTSIPSAQTWHIDTADTPRGMRQGPMSMLVVVALTDVLVEENGPTEVRLMSMRERTSPDNPGLLNVRQRTKLQFIEGQTKKMYLRRGDMMFLDGRTLHRGTTNSSATTRDWLYFVYGRDSLTSLREGFYVGARSMFFDF